MRHEQRIWQTIMFDMETNARFSYDTVQFLQHAQNKRVCGVYFH